MISPEAPAEQIAAQLRGALGLLYRRIRQTRAGAGPTPSESSALSRLEHNGPMTAAQLARLEQVSPQSIGTTLRPLEASGLIARSPDPHDGRRVILSLTGAGREVVHGKRAIRTEQLTKALDALDADQRAALLAIVPVLERLAHEL